MITYFIVAQANMVEPSSLACSPPALSQTNKKAPRSHKTPGGFLTSSQEHPGWLNPGLGLNDIDAINFLTLPLLSFRVKS